MSTTIRGLALILVLAVALPLTSSDAFAARPRPIVSEQAASRWMVELAARLRVGILARFAPELAARAYVARARY